VLDCQVKVSRIAALKSRSFTKVAGWNPDELLEVLALADESSESNRP
jgi:hypothetical protein